MAVNIVADEVIIPYPRPMKTRKPRNLGSTSGESDTVVSRARPSVTIAVAKIIVSLSRFCFLLNMPVRALPIPVPPSIGSIMRPAVMGFFPLTTWRRRGTAYSVAR